MIIDKCSMGLMVIKNHRFANDMFGTEYAEPTEGAHTRDSIVEAIRSELGLDSTTDTTVTVDGRSYRLGESEVAEFNSDGTVLLAVA